MDLLNGWDKYFPMEELSTCLQKVSEDIERGVEVQPSYDRILQAFRIVSPKEVKVVLIGNSPYPFGDYSDGLAFSSKSPWVWPSTLFNIFREIKDEFKEKNFPSLDGNLDRWAVQGVLLLNPILTTVKNDPTLHRDIGWEQITDSVLANFTNEFNNIVYILLGDFAIERKFMIDETTNCVLETSYPSQLSATRGFMGSGVFKKANDYLESIGKKPIDWS